MKKGLTELVFVLDRSGSMGGKESDVIGGFNSVIKKQRELEGEVFVSTVLFDHDTEVLHDRKNIKDVEALTNEEYYVRGSTALLDAVGGAIHHIANVHKYAREEDKPEHVMFFINTDGYENASRKYSYDKIKTMIDLEKKEYDWEFIFMGANIDSFDVASRLGIAKDRIVNTYYDDKEGIKHSYDFVEHMVRCKRSMPREVAVACMADMCFKENEYTEKRKREHKHGK